MSETLSAVVAGSKGFVEAVQGHLKMRLGATPRVASDPTEALRACADKGGLLVLEYAGSTWLEAVKNLRGARGDAGPSIVAAVPVAQASDVPPLQRAGVDEVVTWQGRVDPVIWAVDRIVGRQGARKEGATPPAGPQPSREQEGQQGDETGFELRAIPPPALPGSSPPAAVSPGVPAVAALVDSPTVAPGEGASAATAHNAVPWPDAVPSAAAAEALLLSVSAGRGAAEDGQLAAAERVLKRASDLERAAFTGSDVPVDPGALRAAASLRLRLELALSTLPPAGGAVDHPAAQRLLAEVDGVLARVKALAASAPAGVAPALEPIRLAMVDAGVNLAGALSGLAPAGEEQAAAPQPKKRNVTRLVSNERLAENALASPRHITVAVLLALVVAFAGAYHVRQFSSRVHLKQVRAAAEPGAPSNMFVASEAQGRKLLSSLDGRPPSADALERYRQQETAKGNDVVVVGPTMLLVRAARAGAGHGAR